MACLRYAWEIWLEVNFKLIIVNDGWGVSCKNSFKRMSLDLTDDKSILVQVMARCRQATNHYLSQCWSRSVSPYGITGRQWVKRIKFTCSSVPIIIYLSLMSDSVTTCSSICLDRLLCTIILWAFVHLKLETIGRTYPAGGHHQDH